MKPRGDGASCSARRRSGRGLFGLAPFLLLAAAGCERTLTQADCTAVEQRLRQAWLTDAEAALTAAETEELRPWIGEEADRIGAAWMAQCREMIGRPVQQSELDCLNAATSIETVYACAKP